MGLAFAPAVSLGIQGRKQQPCNRDPWQGTALTAPAPCRNAALAVGISWKTLQGLTLIKGKWDLWLVGLTEQSPQLVTSNSSEGCLKSTTATAAGCWRDVCMREELHPLEQLLWICMKSRPVDFVCLGRKRPANSKLG